MHEPSAQNPPSIQKLFTQVAQRYDQANSILSLGMHHFWKKKLIKKSKIQPHHQILDCATGTGDLAFLFEQKLRPPGQVIGCDFCEAMLDIARQKALQKHSSVQFHHADLLSLPYESQRFDRVSLSFGIRNVQNPTQALLELERVTRPLGWICILEFGQPRYQLLKFFFNLYSQFMLPGVGGWITGHPKAYEYLQTSSAAFPCGKDFLNLLDPSSALKCQQILPLQGGITYLYLFEKQPS